MGKLFSLNALRIFMYLPGLIFGIALFGHARTDWLLFSTTDFIRYSDGLQKIFLYLGLIGVYILIQSRSTKNVSPLKLWIFPLLLITSFVFGLNLYANPDGVFPWNQHPTYIIGGVRSIKLNLYQQIDYSPEVIILGSSRAHVIAGEYFRQEFGKSFFNWSVEGGDQVDALTIENFIFSRQKEKPNILIVEMFPYLLDNWPRRTPLTMSSYLPNTKMYFTYLTRLVTEAISVNSVAKSTFTVVYVDKRPEQTQTRFYPDGSIIVQHGANDQYWDVIAERLPAKESVMQCNGIPFDEQEFIAQVAVTAQDNGVGIVFYISPMNADFFDLINFQDPIYQRCQQQINIYMNGLVKNNDGVYYKNLLAYKPINNMRRNGYFDAEHLTEAGARAVLEALSPEIRNALKWTQDNRGLSK